MKKICKIGTIVCCIVLSICVYPLCLVRRDVNVDTASPGSYIKTEGEAQELKQSFVARTSYLSELDFDIAFPDGKPDTGNLTVEIMNEDGEVIAERVVSLRDVNDDAYTPISVGKWIKKGALYSFTVSGEVIFQAVYTLDGEENASDNEEFYFDGELIEGKAVARYVYGFPLNINNRICLWAFLWMLCFILIGWFGDRDFLCHSKWMLQAEKLLEKWQIPVLVMELAIVLAMIIRICRNEAVDWDEAFTWQIVTKNNVMGMLRATAADVHPPLYYLFVMGAMAVFGKDIFVAKMVSVAGVAATGILGITLVRKRWGVKTAIPFILVSGLGTQMIYFSVNVRMYSWVIFFVMAAGLFAYEIMQSGKISWWIAFTIAALGGVYTQYYAVVPLALIYLGLLFWIILNDRAQIRKWILCSFATVIGYLPWLTVVVDTLKRDAGDTKTATVEQGINELCRWAFKSNIELSEYMPAVLFVVSVLCLFFEWGRFGKKEKVFTVFSGVVFFAAYGLCMVIASHTQHFWNNRYLVDVLLFVWLFMLIVLARKSLLAWGAGMVWMGILALSSYRIISNMELKTVPWTQQTKALFAQIQDEEKIVYNFITFDVIYEYYLPNAEFIWYEDVDFSDMGKEFYMIASPWGNDFSYLLYEEGILEKEVIGEFRMEEAVEGTLRKITFKGVEGGE